MNIYLRKILRILFGIKPYSKTKDGGVFACDVDDTLVMWNIPPNYDGPLITTNYEGFKDICIPNLEAVKHLKKMKARGYAVVVWSAGGSEWAEAAVQALGIEDWVDHIMPKIDFHLDDVHEAKDKLGKWQYIDPQGNHFKLVDGKVVKKQFTKDKVKGDNND